MATSPPAPEPAAPRPVPTYRLTEDQLALRDAVRVLADDRIKPRAAEIDRTAEFPWDVKELLASHDILSLPFPEQYGGLGGDLLTVGIESFTARTLDGLEPDEARIAELMSKSLMLVTALAPEIGYDNAATIAKHAHNQGMTLKQAGLDLGLVDEATFDRVVKPESMLGR